MTAAAPAWPGCHGLRLRSTPFDLGTASGDPIAEATVRVGEVQPVASPEVWRVHAEAATAEGRREVDRWMRIAPDGAYVVEGTTGPALSVDPRISDVTIAPGDEGVTLQLLTSFALPLLVNGHDALVVHGSASANDGGAVVMCGTAGSGKSSSVVRLVDAGWRALTEDVCVLDVRGDVPVAWPGPPWVRRGRGEAGPLGAAQRFESADKTAWDIGSQQARAAVPISRVVLLEPPGGEQPQWQPLQQADALHALAPHTVWLRDPAEAPARLFDLTLRLTRRVPCARLRLPRRKSWLDDLPDVLGTGP